MDLWAGWTRSPLESKGSLSPGSQTPKRAGRGVDRLLQGSQSAPQNLGAGALLCARPAPSATHLPHCLPWTSRLPWLARGLWALPRVALGFRSLAHHRFPSNAAVGTCVDVEASAWSVTVRGAPWI